MVEVPAKLLS